MGDKFVRISQLPESSQFDPDDYIPVENEQDTWKIKFSRFDDYIKAKVDIYEQTIVNVMDTKINEIQSIIAETEEIITNINIKLVEFSNAENDRDTAEREREQNELIRQNNEQDRQNQYNIISIEEVKRIKAEVDRKAAEQERKSAEMDRVIEENTRRNNEQSRQTAESSRITAEDIRIANEIKRQENEANRQSVETDRTDQFNEIKDVIDKFDVFFQNTSKEGISRIERNTSEWMKIPILEIALPKEYFTIVDGEYVSRKKYNALIYLSNSRFSKTRDNTKDGCEEPNYHPGGRLVSIEIYLSIPNNNPSRKELAIFTSSVSDNFNNYFYNEMLHTDLTNDISGGYSMDGNSCIVKIFCNSPGPNTDVTSDYYIVSTSIMWDNIMEFQSSSSKYYSKALSDQSLVRNTGYTESDDVPFKDGKNYFFNHAYDLTIPNTYHGVNSFCIDNAPRGIIDIFQSIGLYIQKMVKNIAVNPGSSNNKYKSYPVGSVYMSSYQANPGMVAGSTNTGVLGGGTWELVTGDGIVFNLDNVVKGTPADGPVAGTPDLITPETETLYIWKRIDVTENSDNGYEIYPTGSVYISTLSRNPGIVSGSEDAGALGGGTWELVTGDGIALDIGLKSETLYIWKRTDTITDGNNNTRYEFYPVGSMYISTLSRNPGIVSGSEDAGALGGGTWELVNNDGFIINLGSISETLYIWKRVG